MNETSCPFYLDDKAFQKLIESYIADNSHRIRAIKSRREYPLPILAFRRWLLARGSPPFTEDVVKQWMLERAMQVQVLTLGSAAIIIAGFCRYLVKRGYMSANPFQALRDAHRFGGYRGMARMLKQTRSTEELDKNSDVPFSGVLAPSFLEYLEYLGGLGKKCKTPRKDLASFERFLRHEEVSSLERISPEHVKRWQVSFAPSSEHRARYRLVVLTGYFNYLLGRGDIASSPMPEIPAHRRRSKPPCVFQRKEIADILTAVSKLPDHRLLPYRGPTYRTVFLLLYTLGLRIREALRLQLQDIDFVENSVTIVDTKFNKGRILPIGPRTASALRQYIDHHPLLKSRGKGAFLFPSDSHRTSHLQRDSCFRTLKKTIGKLGVNAPEETRSPNLHSFRHSFAVHRVERWHREGADLGTKLPLLSAFMGHVDVAATQVYLSMTPERLRLVGERFERAYGSLDNDKEEQS
jgi:integrase/recombinase XerD